MWQDLKGVNIGVVFKNSVYMFCVGWGIEVRLNMGGVLLCKLQKLLR